MLRPLLVLGGCLACAVAHAQWSVSGSTGVRWDHYRIAGDAARSPFPNTGSRTLGELRLDLSGQDAAHGQWQFQFDGLWGAADAFGDDTGQLDERWRLSYRSNSSPLASGFDLGDQYVELSPLTFAREIRGLRLEWLPASVADGRQHAVTAFAGVPGGTWSARTDSDRQVYGGAWAVADNELGRLSAQIVHHATGDDEPYEDEWVASVRAERDFTFAQQQLHAQGEWAHYRDQEHHDEAVLARLTGRDEGLGVDYEFSYEQRGEHFAPSGTGLARDFRSMAARAGLQVAPELVLNGNVYQHTYGVSSEEPLEIHGVGVNLRGPLRSEIDVQSRDRNGGYGKVDSHALAVKAQLELPLFAAGPTRLSSRWNHAERHRSERMARELAVQQSWLRSTEHVDWEFHVGLSYRERSGTTERSLLSPTFGVAANARNHQLAASVDVHATPGQSVFVPDLGVYALSLDYRFQAGGHVFGVEFAHELHRSDGAEDIDVQQIGAYWRYHFTA